MKDLYNMVGTSKQAHHQQLHRISATFLKTEMVLEQVANLRIKHPLMGLKKLYYLIQPEGMGRDIFINLALQAGLGVQMPKNPRRTTYSVKSRRYKNLLHNLVIDDINQVWVSDITYFWLKDKFCYIVLIMDIYSRKIVGYQASANLLASANVKALQMAFQERKNYSLSGLIHHSDKGTQYVFHEYTFLLEKGHILISMCNVVLENAHCERLNGIIKNEYLIHLPIENLGQLQKALSKVVKLYNHERPHWELKLLSPVQFEEQLKNIPINQRTNMKIYVDKQTIAKQKNFNQIALF